MNLAGATLLGKSKPQSNWIPATITTYTYPTALTVTVDGAVTAINATLATHMPVTIGSRVWAVRVGAQLLVVGVQGAYGGVPIAKVYDNVGQTMGNGSETRISLGGIDTLQLGMALTGGDVVVPAAGIYQVDLQAGLHVATNTVSNFACMIGHNRVATYGGDENSYTAPVGSFIIRVRAALVTCAAGDTINLFARADSTTNQVCITGATFLHVAFIG